MNDRTFLYIFMLSWIGVAIATVTGFVLYQYDLNPKEETNIEIIVGDNPVEGEELTFTLLKDGNPVEGVAASVNTENIGYTNEEGEVSYIPEETGQQTVLIENNSLQTSETFEIVESSESDNEDSNLSEQVEETIGQEYSEPQFELDIPKDKETIQTFEDHKEIDFQYIVQERVWAEEAKIEVDQTNDEYTRTISSGQTYGTNFNPSLEASKEGNLYSWRVVLEGDEKSVDKSSEFVLEQVEPVFSVNKNSLDGSSQNPVIVDDYESISKELEVTADKGAEIIFEVYADEDGENEVDVDRDDGTAGSYTVKKDEDDLVAENAYQVSEGTQNELYEYERDYFVAIRYRWNASILTGDGQADQTEYGYFEVQNEP